MDEDVLRTHQRRRRGEGEDDEGEETQKDAHLNLWTVACPASSDKGALPDICNILPNQANILIRELKIKEGAGVMKPGKKLVGLEWKDVMDIRAAEGTNNGFMDYFEITGKFGTYRFESEDSRLVRKDMIAQCPDRELRRTIRGPLLDDDVYDDSILYGDREDHSEAVFECTELVEQTWQEVSAVGQGLVLDKAVTLCAKIWRIQVCSVFCVHLPSSNPRLFEALKGRKNGRVF
jgi:hypothetical protein